MADSPFDVLKNLIPGAGEGGVDGKSIDMMEWTKNLDEGLKDVIKERGGNVFGLDQQSTLTWKTMMDMAAADKTAAYAFAKKLTPKWTDNDVRFMDSWCAQIECKAEDLFLVMATESNLRPDMAAPFPHAKPGSCVAIGLNQVTRVALQDLGMLPWSPPSDTNKAVQDKHDENDKKAIAMFSPLSLEIGSMNVETQFQKVVIPYFNNVAKKYKPGAWTATKLYMSNLAAGSLYLANNPDGVIYKSGDSGYSGNPDIDMNHDGKITVSDVTRVMDYNRQNKPEYIAIMFRYKTLITPGKEVPWGTIPSISDILYKS